VIEARAEEWLKENAANCNDSLGYATTLIKDLLSENRRMREENKLLWGDIELMKNNNETARTETAREAINVMKESYPKSGCYQILQAHFNLED